MCNDSSLTHQASSYTENNCHQLTSTLLQCCINAQGGIEGGKKAGNGEGKPVVGLRGSDSGLDLNGGSNLRER